MLRNGWPSLLAGAIAIAVLCGCQAGDEAKIWSAAPAGSIEGLDAPESVLVTRTTGLAHVSNCQTAAKGFWEKDGKGFISRAQAGGGELELHWKSSSPDSVLHAPKGMCLFAGSLWVADVDRVVRFPITQSSKAGEVPGVRGVQLNDMATDGAAAYVSDTAGNKVLRITADGAVSQVKSPPSPNGLAFHNGRMFAVSWDLHEVYELDATGAAAPKPFGLADHFVNLDGIEVLDDGTFVVTDYMGGKVFTISPDRRQVRVLAELATPADLAVDRPRRLLYVPQLEGNRVAIYRLTDASPPPATAPASGGRGVGGR